MTLADEIRTRLGALQPTRLDIRDDSALHAGHAGNTGGGHFTLHIISAQFRGQSQIMRHRVIYQALADLIPQRIHALSIQADAPDETSPASST